MQPREKQYEDHLIDYQSLGPINLGPVVSDTWRNDPKRLGIKLSRYKTVSKLLSGKKKVLEIGCGDGWASKLVCREVEEFYTSDFDVVWKPYVEAALSNEPNFKGFTTLDPVNDVQHNKYDAIFALDVLEHINPKDEPAFIANCIKMLGGNGLCIFGMPSLESQAYASKKSKEGHVNCQSGSELKENLHKYFENVLIFSFNDEVMHTGFFAMSHYLLAICFDEV